MTSTLKKNGPYNDVLDFVKEKSWIGSCELPGTVLLWKTWRWANISCRHISHRRSPLRNSKPAKVKQLHNVGRVSIQWHVVTFQHNCHFHVPWNQKNTWVQMTFQFAVVQCNCVLLKLKRGREACACSVSGAQMLAFFLWNAAAYFSFHGHCTKVLRTSHLWLCCDTPWQSTKKSFDENCSIHRVQTLNWNLVLNGRSAHSSKTQAHKLVGLRLRHRFKQYRLSFLVLLGPYIICFLSSIFWRKNTSPGANESQVKMCEQAVATDKTTKQAQSMETRSLPQERTPNNNIKG